RLAEGRALEALADAEESLRLKASGRVSRLRTRAVLQLGRFRELRLDDPADLDALPFGGPSLIDSVRRLAESTPEQRPIDGPMTPASLSQRLNRAVALSWLGRRREARDEAAAVAQA